jgi:hypothetical protein
MKPFNITSRSLIIARLSESDKTTAQLPSCPVKNCKVRLLFFTFLHHSGQDIFSIKFGYRNIFYKKNT